jgi:hypothetical protein
MADGNGQPTYSVSIPEGVRERFKPWAAFADRFGLFDAFVADLKRLDHLLSHTPVEWGDPLRDWEHAGLRLFRGMTEHLIAVYAVHLVRRYVFVRDIVLRPDRPLGQSEAGSG